MEREGSVLHFRRISDRVSEEIIIEVLIGRGRKYKYLFGSNFYR